MLLNDINVTECPDCGDEVKSEGRENKHTNGHWNEWREFECGSKYKFSPNFMQTAVESGYICPHNFFKQKLKEEREAFTTKVINYINNCTSVDKQQKERFISAIKYL